MAEMKKRFKEYIVGRQDLLSIVERYGKVTFYHLNITGKFQELGMGRCKILKRETHHFYHLYSSIL